MLLPFTDEYQPSLQIRREERALAPGGEVALGDREIRGDESEHQNLMQTKSLRGVVKCKDCMKSRCLYSLYSPSRMKPAAIDGAEEPTVEAIRLCRNFAMQKLEEAQENEIFVCGMQPFDADDPMYGVIITRSGLECHQPMEFDYYGTKVVASWFNAKLCSYCAGTSGIDGTVDEAHTLEWKSVLPICPTCLAGGARPLVRARRRNGEVHERRAQRAHLLNSRASQVADEYEEQVPIEGGARGEATSSVVVPPATGPRVYRRGRRRR